MNFAADRVVHRELPSISAITKMRFLRFDLTAVIPLITAGAGNCC
tara:strand:+ start:2548 stop:2682 length:135 start_codon:yes stop_codon:yes gene_type:complete